MKVIKFVFLTTLIVFFISGCEFISQPEINDPIIVITFDDADISIYNNALPLLASYNYPVTNVINTCWIGLPEKLNWDQVEELEHVHGWETAGHTLHHVNLPDCDYETALYEIEQDWQNLIDHNLSHETFALPNGHVTSWQYEIILEFYQNVRTSLDIDHIAPVNRTLLGYFAYQTAYDVIDVKQRILQGIENREVMIIIGFHKIRPDDDGYIANCQPEEFAEILDFINNNNFTVLTLKEAINRLVP